MILQTAGPAKNGGEEIKHNSNGRFMRRELIIQEMTRKEFKSGSLLYTLACQKRLKWEEMRINSD